MKILLLIMAGCLFSCSNKKTTLVINNKSGEKIDSVKVSSYGVNEVFKAFNDHAIQKRTVNVKRPAGFSDGAFGIALYKDGVMIKGSTFGYYSTYLEVQDNYTIDILKDFAIKEEVNITGYK